MHIRSKFESNVGIIYPHEVKFDTIFDVPHVDEIGTWISTSLKNVTVMEFQKLILSFSPTVYYILITGIFTYMGVSLNGAPPPKHPKMIIFGRNTHGCWVPAF